MSSNSRGPPVLSPSPRHFDRRIVDDIEKDVEAMLGMLDERINRADDDDGEGDVLEFPPPVLATASRGSSSGYVTPATHRSESTVSSGIYSPRKTSPLKQGFSFSDQLPTSRSRSSPPREEGTIDPAREYPPPRLATSRPSSIRSDSSASGREASTTSSEAGRDLLATLENMHSHIHASPTTPRAPVQTETTPRRTAFSRAWLDPEGAELEDMLAERVTGSGMVMKREMTPVEERTEGGSSASRERDDEARMVWRRGKALPSTPTSSASLPSPTKANAKSATDLIKFFEHAGQETPKRGVHARGISEDTPRDSTKGHLRTASVPDERFFHAPPLETPIYETVPSQIDTLIHPHDSASEVAPNIPAPPTPLPVPVPQPSIPKKSTTSPLRNVRNVVAAWRGNLPTPQPVPSFDTPVLRGDHEAGRKGKGNVFEEAFFTIRRMSTRRRKKEATIGGGDGGGEKEGGRVEKPLPAVVDREEMLRDVHGRQGIKAVVVSALTEMTSEPVRVGEIWYLNVHDPSGPYRWIKCDAQLYADRLVLTWIPDNAAAGCRGIVTLDLVHCLEVRSIPSPNHPSAVADVGSIAAKAVPGLSDDLYPFQLVYDDGVERLGAESARDRVRWVSAIWDILENSPSEEERDEAAAVSSENGSRSTILHRSPGLSGPQDTWVRPTILEHRFSRASDDIHIGDSQTGVLPLKRNSSRHLGRGNGSLLRRVASEADLDLDALAAPMNLARHPTPPSSDSSGSKSSGVLQGSLVDVAARPRMTPMSRLQTSSTTGSSTRYESIAEVPVQEEQLFSGEDAVSSSRSDLGNVFRTAASRSIPSSFSTESSERLPSYSSAITVLPVRELEPAMVAPPAVTSRQPSNVASDNGLSFATPMSPPRLPPRRDLWASSTAFQTAPGSPMASSSSKISSTYSTPKGSIVSKRTAPLPSPVGPREKAATPSVVTDYFTATKGSGSYFTPRGSARDPFRSITPSSVSHAAFSLDHTASDVSSNKTVSTAKTSSRIPVPSGPSSSSSSTATRSSTSSSTPRPGASSTGTGSSTASLPRRILETVIDNERARVGDTTVMASQLDRIETAVADIGSFLSVPPALLPSAAQSVANDRRSQNAPSPESPSSPSSSSSSSSDTATQPGTPTEGNRLFRDLASIKEQNRALMEQQLKVQQMLESGEDHRKAPNLDRIEDLLLRLLERSGDSEILMDFGSDDAQTQQGFKSGRLPSVRSRRTFASTHQQSIYSDEQGARAPAPAPSINTEYERERRARMSGVPESLLDMSSHLTEELDEEWELQNLPPGSPDIESQPRRRAMPPVMLNRRNVQPYESRSPSEPELPPVLEPPVQDQLSSEEETPRPVQRPVIVPRPVSTDSESESTTTSSTPSPRRRPFRPGPAPRPVEIPSPVRPEGYPPVVPPPSFRPGMPYPRPSRLASGREPMTTTYFRRGFPPPALGPFMSGVGPGMPGFGGPFGPNVFPRPGYMPPGTAGGNYGLPRRPFFPARPPRMGSPTASSTRGYTNSHYSYSDPGSHQTEDLQEAVNHLDQVQHEAIDKADALAEAQGLQANEIGRYLHELGSVMDSNRVEQMRELMTLHEDIGRIRDQLNHPPPPLPAKSPPRLVVPPSPAVQVTVNNEKPTQQMPAAVMNITEQSESGESPILPYLPTPTNKDLQQDALLRDLQDKVTDLGRKLAESERHQQPIEKIIIKETEYDPQQPAGTFTKPLPPQPSVILGPPVSVPPPPLSEYAPSVSQPHVHFGPEHVKETTTEVIRGPAGQDIEREIVREYDRTPSEIAAGLLPSHETVVETKTTQRPISTYGGPGPQPGAGTWRDPAGTVMHDAAGPHGRVTTIIEEDVVRPQSQYPVSHAPPSTGPPSVIHVSADPPRPPNTVGDARRQSIPPSVLGPSDLHNRPTVSFAEHPDGLLVKPVPSKTLHPSVDREHPVQLSNIPTRSQPPVLQQIPVATTVGPGSAYADEAIPQSRPVLNVPPAGTSAYAPTVHGVQIDQGHSLGDTHPATPVKGWQNKLKKVPSAATHPPATTHANVSPESQLDPSDIPQGAPIPSHDQAHHPANHEHADTAQQPHIAHSDATRPATISGDQPGRKGKAVRDRPVATHVPTVLSTPPLLGSQNMASDDGHTMANVPVEDVNHSYPDGHSVAGTAAQSDAAADRPNVLKKKPSRATPSSKHGNSAQAPGAHFEGADDHTSQVNVRISNDGHDGKDGHGASSHDNDRPHPPPIRGGQPSVSHADPSRPATLHLPTQDGKGGHDSGASSGKSNEKHAKSPEDVFKDSERLAAQSKAKAEQAELERVERENMQRRKEEKEKLASSRHQEHVDAMADLKKAISDHHSRDEKWKATYADSAKDKEQWESAFDKLLCHLETDKKWRETEGKKPGADAVIDFLKKSNEDQTAFLRSLAADIMAQNADQHKTTKESTKAMAREQVAFNVAGYLDDFSKALSGEVRALLKEVGDLRETRRALYYELAELLLLKGRQSAGDLMAVMPWPGPGNAAGPARPAPPPAGPPKAAPPKQEAAKPAAPPAAPPAWQSFNIPAAMSLGGLAIGSTAVPSSRPAPPAGGSRPLPVPGNAEGK